MDTFEFQQVVKAVFLVKLREINMDLMIVDDDEDDIALFCEAVAEIDPSLVCAIARNGVEALQNLERYARLPKCIFLDVNMPLMGGKETLVNIRQQKAYSGISVVMFSTSQNPAEIAEFRGLGVDFVIKPNSFEEIIDLIRKRIGM